MLKSIDAWIPKKNNLLLCNGGDVWSICYQFTARLAKKFNSEGLFSSWQQNQSSLLSHGLAPARFVCHRLRSRNPRQQSPLFAPPLSSQTGSHRRHWPLKISGTKKKKKKGVIFQLIKHNFFSYCIILSYRELEWTSRKYLSASSDLSYQSEQCHWPRIWLESTSKLRP